MRRRRCPDYGRDLGRYGPELDLPHELTDLIWDDGSGGWCEGIELFFAVYDDMPAYGHLMYVKHHYAEFGPADRERWWLAACTRLARRGHRAPSAAPVRALVRFLRGP